MKTFFQRLFQIMSQNKPIVLIGIVMFAIILMYTLLQLSMERLTYQLEENKKMLIKVREQNFALQEFKNQPKTAKNLMMIVVQQSFRNSPLKNTLVDITQNSDGTVALSFNNVNFDELMRYLMVLRYQKGIVVDSFKASAIESQLGYVIAEIVLR